MEESWSTIESDPGVFTALMQEMGVRDVQVEELYSLESEALQALQPVHGLVFLFKYQSAPALETPPAAADDSRVFFAQQVIPNACATQAILSVLLNRPEIEIGPDLTSLKEFTADFPAEMRGHAIGNSETIRRVHNSFHPPDPIATEDLRATEEDEAFHFVSYVPFEGAVYELDGLTPGPLRLGSATEETWMDVARPRIQQRIEAYSGAEIRFNLMAIVKNRVTVAKEALEAAQELQEALSVSLSDDSSPEERAALEQTQHQISSLQAEILQEESKFESWRNENIRRKTNYVPFIFTFLQTLAER
eukprot:CAMPEP_0206145270 /NCGR_PEP_ID=MMETSP1473-20131121/26851_1 /ASSEMBLY_ACC=CAM_ASM_001109 /TAXON_ID=1461547 /ORGANISM="Stichococcus sp, Strain RCC1054" /LENGTH=304 /DNA_ID=CAMNT_0053541415 /DNA_START=206 /DNA_END=1116 /DNA_ORIENTATION=-